MTSVKSTNFYTINKKGNIRKMHIDNWTNLEEWSAIQARSKLVENKLARIAEGSMRLNQGNTKRSEPLKKIAEIKKAQKKLNKAIKNDPSLDPTFNDNVFCRQQSAYLQDFLPRKKDKTNKYRSNMLKEARSFRE